ncbi:MAG TPA: anhydro-N-acetylmuramic acid kinase [Longimicrobiales bacterium]|nr:anhydro-N-acetylmuramic acid kinase [Longimicrobiales bacterium]
MIVLGLMSGTSMDGVDAALLELRGDDPAALEWTLLAFRSLPYDRGRRARLRSTVDGGGPEALCVLDADLGEWLAEAALALLDGSGVAPGDVAAVGSHGHTVWHRPPGDGRRGATLQLGDPATLAARTGIPVVSDFRAADVAAGGHGAPLVPWPDRALFALPDRSRALQNLGGVGNVTWLPPRGADAEPVAFDTGPGNGLLDAAARFGTAGRLEMDVDGALAAAGTPDPELLAGLLAHPFLAEPPPRSTGREVFGPALVRDLAQGRGLEPDATPEGWRDLLATLVHFTARTVADAYGRWLEPLGVDEVVLTGGGARNPGLVRLLREELAPLPVLTGADALGMDPDAREAAAFAVLAWAHLRGIPANIPGATGASGPRVLGSWTPAPGRGRAR